MLRKIHLETRNLRSIFIAALLGAMATGANSAIETPLAVTAQPVPAFDELTEIWVRGKHLSEEIEDAEDDFFKLFNKLNRTSNYDIHCGYMSLQPASMIMVRTCVPGFVANYRAASFSPPAYDSYGPVCYGVPEVVNGSAYYSGGCYGPGPATSIPAPSLAFLAMHYSEAFVDNLLKVTNGDPRLLAKAWHLDHLYGEMQQLQGQYVNINADDKTRAAVARKVLRSGATTRH